MSKTFSHVGQPVLRQDGLEKVTGSAKYADDYCFEGQLYGVMVRIPEVHAKIDKIDYSAVADHPEVIAVCDSRDVPAARKVGAIHKDQPVFCDDTVVSAGDAVAMLVGESETELLRLRERVKIDYTPLPVLSDPREALKPGAPLIHPEQGSNLIVHYPLRKGDIEKGFAESDFTIEQTYTTPLVEHAYLEPEAVIALPREGKKGIKVIGSIQNPYTTRKVVAAVLGWPLARVRIEQAELGGSFGGKDDIMNVLSARAAVAALKTGRPVKIRYSREDSVLESYKRHPYIMHYKAGFTKDCKITAMKIDITADGGAYASMSPFVTWRTVVQATGPYEIEHVHTDVRAVYTNNPYTGAMRGFGSPQPIFAQESLMDEIAIQLGITPTEIRRRNGFKAGSITASGQKLKDHDVNLITVLDTAAEHTGFAVKWQENRQRNKEVPDFLLNKHAHSNPGLETLETGDFIPPEGLLQKGIGLATSFRGCSLGAEGIDATASYLSVQSDGSVYLLSGLAENGQGLRTTFSIIVAEVLGIPVDDVYYLEMDTALVPDSGPTVASRSTLMGGGAIKDAADTIRRRLESLLLSPWELKEAEFIFKDSRVRIKGDDRKTISFSDLCTLAFEKAVNLAAVGWYPGPKVHWEEEKGQGDAYFTYVYGCQVAEVTVNTGTGEVYVDRVTAVHDSGRIINLLGAQGQVYGGVTQGAGYAVWEEVDTHNGSPRELNFDQYLMPTSLDIGEITPIFVEGEEKYGPWGAKSLGEPALELTAAAIANAVRNAVGVRYFNLPLNLEEILLKRKLRPHDLMRGSA
jgi:CO/xanthine dehydrogenase Mo-binding subunit